MFCLTENTNRTEKPPQGHESYLNTMVKNRMVKPFLHGVHLKNKMNTMGKLFEHHGNLCRGRQFTPQAIHDEVNSRCAATIHP
ncbi:MAG: hypothetical protein UH734_01170, partial [Ruminococcus sp.]|nr:hypothetical protein [Ruminococcus sp.]